MLPEVSKRGNIEKKHNVSIPQQYFLVFQGFRASSLMKYTWNFHTTK